MGYAIRLLAALCCASVGFALTPAHAEKRVALVIGNAAYQYTRILPNPKNDAEAIAKLLADIGFTDVELKIDLDYRAMRAALRALGETASGAEVALIYFAGHGLEIGGENYLLPVDAKLVRDRDLEYEAIGLASVLHAVGAAQKLKVVILDACRNNPFGDKILLSSGATRTASRGLGRIEPKGDVLVAYSARAGTLAKDGEGRHSPYAEALLQHLPAAGLDIIRMFGRVKEAVLKATNDEQEPWLYGSPSGDVITLVPAKAVPGLEHHTKDEVEWIRASAANRLDAYRDYIKSFPTGEFAQQALLHIAALEQLAAQWEALKVGRDLPKLRSFANESKTSEFGPIAAIRLKELETIEAAAWHEAKTKQRLANYQNFLAAWPQGFFAAIAHDKIEELEAIRSEWLKVKESEDETVIEAFVFRHGWNEYGVEAVANLVALRRARSSPNTDRIKTLAADEMLQLIDNAAIVFHGSGEIIQFRTLSMPAWRPRLGKNFLKQMLREDLAAEGAFVSKGLNRSARTTEGLGAIVRSRVDKTGSLFLLQLDGSERSGKDVDTKDRQFKTLQVVSDSFGYVCIATEWHSILADTKPLRTPERCTINKK
jgi:Caspase domain